MKHADEVFEKGDRVELILKNEELTSSSLKVGDLGVIRVDSTPGGVIDLPYLVDFTTSAGFRKQWVGPHHIRHSEEDSILISMNNQINNKLSKIKELHREIDEITLVKEQYLKMKLWLRQK